MSSDKIVIFIAGPVCPRGYTQEQYDKHEARGKLREEMEKMRWEQNALHRRIKQYLHCKRQADLLAEMVGDDGYL